jgi:hypothetical protein
MVTTHTPAPVQAPNQPTKLVPGSLVAVSVTVVPIVNLPVHVGPQSIVVSPVVLRTNPVPVPTLVSAPPAASSSRPRSGRAPCRGECLQGAGNAGSVRAGKPDGKRRANVNFESRGSIRSFGGSERFDFAGEGREGSTGSHTRAAWLSGHGRPNRHSVCALNARNNHRARRHEQPACRSGRARRRSDPSSPRRPSASRRSARGRARVAVRISIGVLNLVQQLIVIPRRATPIVVMFRQQVERAAL